MPDKYTVVQFLKENNATKVVPYSWLKTEEGQLFCRWPKTYKVSEIRLAINRGDPPASNWVDKIVKKLYPLKKDYESRIKCDMKESKLYEEGSAALDTDVSRTTVVNRSELGTHEEPYSYRIPSGFKSSKRKGKPNKRKKSKKSRKEYEGVESSSGFGEASSAEDRERRGISPSTSRIPLQENPSNLSQSYPSTSTPRTAVMPSSNMPSGSKLQDPLTIPVPDNSSAQSSDRSNQEHRGEAGDIPMIRTPSSTQISAARSPRSKQKIIDESESGSEFGVEDLSGSDSDSSSSSSSSSGSDSGLPSNSNNVQDTNNGTDRGAGASKPSKTCSRKLIGAADGNMAEPPMRKVLRRLYKIEVKMAQQFKSLHDSIAELRAQLNGGSTKTALDIIPGVQLPVQDPDQLKIVEKYVGSSVDARKEFVKYLQTKAVGSKATTVGNGLMFGIMTNFCAAHLVWDGVHKGASSDLRAKLALKIFFPNIEDTLQTVMNSVATPTISKEKIKGHVGRLLTLASTRLTAEEKTAIKLPWVFTLDA